MKIVKGLFLQIFHRIPTVRILMEVKFPHLTKRIFQAELAKDNSKI